VHVQETKTSVCAKNEFFKRNGTCLSFVIEQAPAIVSTPVYIAIAGGFAALIAIAAILGFLLKKSKSDSDILLKGVDPFHEGAIVENPIHVPSTNVSVNPIFNSAGGGDKDL